MLVAEDHSHPPNIIFSRFAGAGSLRDLGCLTIWSPSQITHPDKCFATTSLRFRQRFVAVEHERGTIVSEIKSRVPQLWFLRFKDYNRGLSGMSDGLKDFLGESPQPSPSPAVEANKSDSKLPSRSATPPLPHPKTTRSNSRGRENAPPQDENLQETYTARVHEAIEKVRSSSTEHLPGISGYGSAPASVSRVPAAVRGSGESTSGREKGDGSSVNGGPKASGASKVPVEKPGGGDILDVGQKEKVELTDSSSEPPVKAPGEGDVLDAGLREEVSLPDVDPNRRENVERDADVGTNAFSREVPANSKGREESAEETK